MVLSNLSIAVKKALGLMLQRKPLNTVNDCKYGFSNPSITKAVLTHLVSVKEGDEDTDIIMKQIRLVTATLDPTSKESVMLTIIRVFTHLDDSKLPALAKTAGFQKKMVEVHNEKLKKALRKNYDPFIMKMMEYKT